jgi:hypothetical protein
MRLGSKRIVRLLLSVSLSVWMAGGCLFGCSSSAMGAEVVTGTESSTQAVESGASCHAKHSHDCCATTKPKKRIASTSRQLEGVASFIPAPRSAMKDCPLVVNSTAATSKSSSYLPDPGRAPTAFLPQFDKLTELPDNTLVVPFLPNRGPTHLRCCVFLI